jgi:plasmid stabilization system protein ParE
MTHGEPLAVVLEARAAREIAEIDAWWRENREAAPELFADELLSALDMIALVPSLGAPARSPRLPDLRRVLLRRTQYYVYYRVSAGTLHGARHHPLARRTPLRLPSRTCAARSPSSLF